MRRQKNKVGVAFVLILSAFVLSGCGNKRNVTTEPINETQSEESQVNETDKEIIPNSKSKSEEEDVYWDKVKAFCECAQMVEMEDTVTIGDWSYHVNSAEITKKKGDWNNPDWNRFEYDSDGNLINEYSFVKANITFHCLKKSERTFYLNLMTCHVYDKTPELVTGSEMVTAVLDKSEDKDFFEYDMQKGDTLTTDVVFIIEDKFVGEDYKYIAYINIAGGETVPEDIACIKLKLK